VAVDNIMIVVPGMFVEVFPVLVVERQQRLDVVAGIFICESFCSLADAVVTPAQQSVGNGRVDDLSRSPALRSSLFKVDIHTTHWWNTVIGESYRLVDSDSLKSDITILAAGTEQ
jgi:hypothetical protein